MRHVFSMDMDRDADLYTLAETAVMCRLKMESGSCKRGMCASCETRHELESCMSALPACDSLRVKNIAQDLYGKKRFQYGLDKPTRQESWEEIKDAIKVGAITLLEVAVVVALGAGSVFGLIWLCNR